MSSWPFLVVLPVYYAIVGTPLFVAADTPPDDRPGRARPLDGLRGVLALGVVVAHATLFRTLARHGRVADLYGGGGFRMGEVAVALFFMITGYLFWSTLLREAGRPNWLGLYTGRIFRIGPLYLIAVAALFAVVLVDDGFRPRYGWPLVLRHAADWLALGAHEPVDLDGTGRAFLLLGVAWTLRYEWRFYAALLPLSLLARRRRAHLPVIAASLALALAASACSGGRELQPGLPVAIALFLSGMFAGSVLRVGRLDAIPNAVRSSFALALLAVALAFRLTYAAVPVAFLGAGFLLIASGADIFGLLTRRAARRAGDVSYGIYLLHLFVLDGVIHVGPLRRAFLSGAAGFWTVTLAVAIASTALATAAHVTIERPGIALGKRVHRIVRDAARRLPDGVRGARS